MKRTILLTAVVVITVTTLATPAFARRDPGAGGMALYNYGPTPPRIGQAGLNNQYADGMNLYQYVQSNPTVNTVPHGLWGQNIHERATRRWATQVGYPREAAAAIGAANEAVDSGNTSFMPSNLPFVGGDQRYHFNRTFAGDGGKARDTRMQLYRIHMMQAKAQCLWSIRIGVKNDNPEDAAKYLGTALHPYQDWVAHGDYGILDRGEVYTIHNAKSTQKDFGDPRDYPDDPFLDAKNGPDGRPAGVAMTWISVWTSRGYSERGYAIYEQGTKRYRLTMTMTKDALEEFRTWVKQFGGCKCREYFGVTK